MGRPCPPFGEMGGWHGEVGEVGHPYFRSTLMGWGGEGSGKIEALPRDPLIMTEATPPPAQTELDLGATPSAPASAAGAAVAGDGEGGAAWRGPAVVGGAVAVLLGVSLWVAWPVGTATGPPWVWLGFVVAAAVAGLHRPFAGRGLTLGVVALPPLVALAGPVAAALGALVAVLLAEGVRTWGATRWPLAPPTRPRPVASFVAAGRTAVAALVAGAAWELLNSQPLVDGSLPPAALPRAVVVTGSLAGLVYLAVTFLLRVAERHLRRTARDRRLLGPAVAVSPPLRGSLPRRAEGGSVAVEGVAWLVGVVVAWASLEVWAGSSPGAGRAVALSLVAALSLVTLEAVRLASLRVASEERMGDMDRVRSAGQRMVGNVAELEAVVDRIREELANVVPYHWFHFEFLAEDDAESRSWYSSTGEALQEGVPRPESHPPPLPGIHRRPDWRIIQRSLAWGERAGARITLWCDPRQLDGEDLELLDALLPQMATSIRQSLLDREAKEDRLTGAVVRRVLERRLLAAYRNATEGGLPVAVIMCDLDHFKPINDVHGHLAGDKALVAAAEALAEHKRTSDLLARYGGEEFTLLLENTDGATALRVAERLRGAIEAIDFEVDGTPVPLRISCGVAAFPELHVKTATELILLADGALYEAKRQGRNRCLLDEGGGTYRTPDGEVVESEDPPTAPEAPRIFA